MDKVIFFQQSMPEIGLKVRSRTEGPEWELVQKFIGFQVNKFACCKKKNSRWAIFYEPLLETGFPDIVIAEYNTDSFEGWQDSRLSLNVSDLKIFQHIYQTGGINSNSIEKQLGIDSKNLLRTLEKLLDSGLIKRSSNQWMASSFHKTFGVKKLVTVEAKLHNWSNVFEQANLNKLFSSETYVLSAVVRPTDKILKQSQKLGIGIYTLSNKNGFKKIIESQKTPFPGCYKSLLFNEWIGRRLKLN